MGLLSLVGCTLVGLGRQGGQSILWLE
jgi:hypothetical protein